MSMGTTLKHREECVTANIKITATCKFDNNAYFKRRRSS